jgi:hypothetical protein
MTLTLNEKNNNNFSRQFCAKRNGNHCHEQFIYHCHFLSCVIVNAIINEESFVDQL